MPKKAFIFLLLLGVACIGIFLWLRALPNDTVETVASSSPRTSTSSAPLPNLPSSSVSSLSTSQSFHPVTLQDIATIASPAESNDFYLRLTSELMGELQKIQESHDRDRITSRLTPVAQKIFYLKKRHRSFENAPPLQLPDRFSQEIQELAELWNDNHVLGETADSVFARLDILDCEHVPYQLRAQIVSQ